MEAKLYLECHITIEPVFDDRLEHVKSIAENNNFKVAALLMQKRETDTAERSKYDTFMTGHSKTLADIQQRMVKCITDLKNAGFKVWRYKIEDTIMDSRSYDELGLLEDV